MKKALFFLFVILRMAINDCYAYDFKDGDFYYSFVNSDVIVTCINKSSSNHPEYCGKTTITIPNKAYNVSMNKNYNVIGIDDGTFSGCDATKIIIPNSVISIGNRAFAGCLMSSIEMSNNLTTIGEWAFSQCINLTAITLPDGLTSIGSMAFRECTSLTSILIPQSVANIGDCPLTGCTSINTIKVAPGNTLYDSRSDCNAIIETATNTLIQTCKNSTVPNGVEKIAYHAFDDYPSRTSITLPKSLREIGYGAFDHLTSLTSIVIPSGVTIIGEQAFFCCSGLTNYLYLPEGLTEIGDYAFYGCSGLPYVKIPKSVTSIGEYAFRDCDQLRAVEVEHKTPIDISTLSCNPFGIYANASLNAGLIVPARCKENYVDAVYWKDFRVIEEAEDNLIDFEDDLVKSICVNNWDSDDDGDISYDEAEAVTTLPNNIFSKKGIKNFPEFQYFTGITEITNYAFQDCSELTNISLPNSLTIIGQGAFERCSALESIIINEGVTSIGYCAFADCSSLQSVDIPSTVNKFGNDFYYNAFLGCTSLETINISSANAVFTTGGSGSAIIKKDNNLLITGCKNTIIPASVRVIGPMAFQKISTLTSITIPENVVGIMTSAFEKTGLTSIIIPEGVTTIEDYSFTSCKQLAVVELPASLESIGEYTFTSSTNLKKVVCHWTTSNEIPQLPTSYGSPFSGISSDCSLYVPSGTIDMYVAKRWTTNVFKGGIYESNKSEQTLALTSIPEMTYGDAAYTLPQTTAEGLILTWTVANANIATVSSNVLTINGAGTTTVTATQEGNDDYELFSKEFTLTVNPKNASNLTINSISAVTYNGSAQTPNVTVKDGTTTLTSGTHYTVAYSNNTNAGTATATITGMGNYTGTKNASFTINPKNASNLTINSIAAQTYTGVAKTPTVTVKDGSTTLTNGTHYTVAYNNNINAGTATVTVTGKGNYTGTKTANFTINPKNASNLTINSISARTYNGSAQTPTVTVKDGSTTLTSGTHYTVAYSNNTNAGTATVTITGKDNYTGTKTAYFTINKAPLTITAKSYTINQKDDLPEFEVTYSGFKNSETSSVLTTQPTITCDATDSETAGVFDITLSGAAATNYSFNYVKGTLTINEVTSVSIAVNSYGKGTCRGELPLDFTNVSGIYAYIVSGFKPSEGNLVITMVDEVPARTGLYIVGTPGTTYNIPVKETDFYYSTMMKGVLVATVIPANEDGYTNYVLSADGHGGVIFKLSNNASSPANRAYVQIPSSIVGARKHLGIETDDGSTTGLDGVFTPDTEEAEGDYYNLNGQKVQNLKRGIYIKNGKKVIIH